MWKKTATHQVGSGNSQLRSIYTDDLFKRKPVVDEKKASVTGNTMKQ